MPEREATRRLFFALWPEAALAGRLHELGRAARDCCGGRPMRREGLHATLAFLGDVPGGRYDDAVAAAAKVRTPPFELVIDRLDYWRHNHILWAGTSWVPPALEGLVNSLGQSLRDAGFRLEARAFALHVTLLRHADCRDAAALPRIDEPLVWRVGDFALVESLRDERGARYEPRQRWPLAAAVG